MPDVRKLAVPVPPIAEQEFVIRHIQTICGRVDSRVADAEQAIALLQERRCALISAAVTGKIDVRGFVHVTAAAA